MHLSKHHGLGNDFLVVLDPEDERRPTPDEVITVCHRTRGVGADGLLHVRRGGTTDLVMILHNADGSRAEMSGNGISCVGQAALLEGLVDGPKITIDSDAGIKTLEHLASNSPTAHTIRVDLGAIDLGADVPEWVGDRINRARRVDVGNPHVVLHVDDHEDVDLVHLGTRANEIFEEGANVETVVVTSAGLSMRVYERGVGLTDACGTGACASAAAAHAWGLAGEKVVVEQPGGRATVEVGEVTHYTVEVSAIARVEWPWPREA